MSDDVPWLWIGLGLLLGVVIGVFAIPSLSSSSIFPISKVATPARYARIYTNFEEWEVKRDMAGRLVGIAVHREAGKK